MNLLQILVEQLSHIKAAVNVTGALGCIYGLVRFRRCWQGKWRVLGLLLTLPGGYWLATTLAAIFGGFAVAGRYHQPVLPFLLIFSANGLYCLLQDVQIKVAGAILLIVVGGSLADMLGEPVRSHRAAQEKAGRWLKKHDPDYDGFVFSDYSQPVYYAGMEYLPAEAGLWLVPRLSEKAAEVKYAVLEHDTVGLKSEHKPGSPEESIPADALSEVVMETGIVEIDHRWTHVKLTGEFPSPPVILCSPPTFHDRHPGVIRIKKRGTSGFNLRFQECAYQNDRHLAEKARWLAVESGMWKTDGTACLVSETVTIRADEPGSPQRVDFQSAFARPPVVFAQVQTLNETDPVTVRVSSVDREGFSVFLQEEQAQGPHGPELVGYLAVDPLTRNIAARSCAAGVLDDEIRKSTQVQIDGVDAGLLVREERSADQEIDHMEEQIGVLCFEESPYILANLQTCNDPDYAVLRLIRGGGTWMERYVSRNNWEMVYWTRERNIHIYQNPHYRKPGAATPEKTGGEPK